jgi:L-ascorbate metabolism protein UlaG (beta-lactamase superfamily)
MKSPQSIASDIRSIPLVNSWFAHPYLVSPLTFGLYTRHAHLPMLDSYVEDPEQHRISVKMPELLGGPFIDYPGDVEDIRRFRDASRERCALHLRRADAINSMYQMLQASAKGAGIAGLYAQVDELIRHGVDLSYDVCKQPIARFIEPAFYDSPAWDPGLQSCVLEKATPEPRSFVLSTPQIRRSPSAVELRVPFADPLWHHVHGGTPGGDLLERLRPHVQDPARDMPLLQDLFTAPGSRSGEAPGPSDTVRIRYFGHACVLLECGGVSILVDPLISYAGESSIDHYTFDDLPARIDYVLITHPHQDHIVFETMLKLRGKVDRVVVGRASGGSLPDVSLKLMLQHCGFDGVIELGEYESIEFKGGRIIGAPFYGEHADLDIRAKLAYGVEMRGISCLFFADSNPPAPEFYEPLKRMMPRVDCVFLGMECVGAPATWLYGPLLQKMLTRGEDQSRRLDGCNAATALKLREYFKPRRLYIYAMGAEPWLKHITSILYSEDSVQFKEARLVESTLRAQGDHAEVLFGKMELML